MPSILESELAEATEKIGETTLALSRPNRSYRTSFGLPLLALAELKLLAIKEGTTEKAILDGIAALCTSPQLNSVLEGYVMESGKGDSEESRRRTRVVSKVTLKLLDEIASRLSLRRDAVLEGLIMFAVAYFRLERIKRKKHTELALERLEKLLDECYTGLGEVDCLLRKAGSQVETFGITSYLEDRTCDVRDEIRKLEKTINEDAQQHDEQVQKEIERLRENKDQPSDEDFGD